MAIKIKTVSEADMRSVVPTWYDIPDGYLRSFVAEGTGWVATLDTFGGELWFSQTGEIPVGEMDGFMTWVDRVAHRLVAELGRGAMVSAELVA